MTAISKEDVKKLADAFGYHPNPFIGKPDWVRKKVRNIIHAEIKAQGSNDGILTFEHLAELIEKVEKNS